MQKGLTTAEAMSRAAGLFSSQDFRAAEALCDAILRADARHFYALHLLATIAVLEGRFEDGIGLASRAIEIDPRHAEALCNRGAALRALNRFEEALQDYDRALAAMPGYASAWNNRGVALAALNRHAQALEAYEHALAIDANFVRARFNRSLSRLVQGDFAGGLPDYEFRWAGSDLQGSARAFRQPRWTGHEDLRGKTILLYAEQGFGDTIQFCRYASQVRALGATVLLEVQAPLTGLAASLAGVDAVIAAGEALPAFDFHCPLISLALALGTRLESIPHDVPYLAARPERIERWRAKFGKAARPRVGLVWSGSASLKNDRNRSIAFSRLRALQADGCALVSLQKDVREADRAELAASAMPHFEDEIADFEDTAALVALMDLVISVDTSVAHLAGAMARPVWLLVPFSPDWRWLLEREDSPWYPTARIFRQPRIGDWDAVIGRVQEELRRFAAVARPGAE